MKNETINLVYKQRNRCVISKLIPDMYILAICPLHGLQTIYNKKHLYQVRNCQLLRQILKSYFALPSSKREDSTTVQIRIICRNVNAGKYIEHFMLSEMFNIPFVTQCRAVPFLNLHDQSYKCCHALKFFIRLAHPGSRNSLADFSVPKVHHNSNHMIHGH